VVASSLLLSAQAPTPIVERLVEVSNRIVRTSLFSNREVVVSIRVDGDQVALRQISLSEDEFTGYFAAIQRDARDIARSEGRPPVESMAGRATITLHVGPAAPRVIEYSPVAVLDLPTSRLVTALDDLERRVLWGEPSSAELDAWQPRRGERVELRNGVEAEVIEVQQDGTVVVEHDNTWIHEVISPEHRAKVILRVLTSER
jgi:hypothetical protein